MKLNSSYNENGFTLVELAIVMIIIGLLIGGVLKGQELVTNAKLNSTYKNIESYRSSIYTFKDKYSRIPGDMSNAGARLRGCTASTACVNAGGNNDGVVGTRGVTNWSHDDQSENTSEATQLWVHLALADLIAGVSAENIQEWGDLYPSTPIGGGLQVFHAEEALVNQAYGHFLILRLLSTGDPHPNVPGDAVLSPFELSYLELKFDDMVPNTGIIISDDMMGCWDRTTFEYDLNNDDKICISAYKFF